MDFDKDHYPDYRPGYTDYNTMREHIWKENAKITDFAMCKGMTWDKYDVHKFDNIAGFDIAKAKYMDNRWDDVYISICKIPE
jgi:hypothetical protein